MRNFETITKYLTETVFVLFIYLFVVVFFKQEQIREFVGDIRIKLQLCLHGTKEQKRWLEIIGLLTISCGLIHKNFVCQNTICLLNYYFKSFVNFMNKTKHGKTTSRNQTTTHKKYYY